MVRNKMLPLWGKKEAKKKKERGKSQFKKWRSAKVERLRDPCREDLFRPLTFRIFVFLFWALENTFTFIYSCCFCPIDFLPLISSSMFGYTALLAVKMPDMNITDVPAETSITEEMKKTSIAMVCICFLLDNLFDPSIVKTNSTGRLRSPVWGRYFEEPQLASKLAAIHRPQEEDKGSLAPNMPSMLSWFSCIAQIF